MYKRGGESAIRPRASGRKVGEKSLLSESRSQEIRQILIDNTPDELGMPYSLWTRQIACDFVRHEYGFRIPLRSMTNYFKKWGFSCRTPMKSQGSAEFRQFMEEAFPDIIRRAVSENVGIYWFCESWIHDKNTRIIAAATARGTARFTFATGRMSQSIAITIMSRLIRYADRKVFFLAPDIKAFRGEKAIAWLKGRENRIEVFYHPVNNSP